jgi:hypothetical protein
MKIAIRTTIAAMAFAAVLSGLCMAGNAVNWAAAGKTIYPYKDLPGVTAPQQQTADEKFTCHTTTIHPYWWRGGFYRGLPRLGYVCEQNGVVSWSTRPPNWSYWQYNDPHR